MVWNVLSIACVVLVLCFLLLQSYLKCKRTAERGKMCIRKWKRRFNLEKRIKWTPKQAAEIYGYTQGLCYYCHLRLGAIEKRRSRWEIDHIVAYVLGGPNDDVVAACFKCNQGKKHKTLEKFCNQKHIWPSCRFIDPITKTFTCHHGVMHIESRFCTQHNMI